MQACLIVFILIAFDIVTGITKALAKGYVKSSCLREGLFRKCGEIFSLFGAWMMEYANQALDMGVNIPLYTGVAVYISIMEITSIIENICEINPRMASIFKPYLDSIDKTKEEDNEEKRD